LSAAASAPMAEPAMSEPVVALSSNSTVKDAAALKSTLEQIIEAPGSVTIDAKSVERIDTAIIQVLCAFVRDRAERNLAIAWRGTPQPLFDAARLLGVGALLALPSQAEA
jgi:anti-anti-sigma regulatory factor